MQAPPSLAVGAPRISNSAQADSFSLDGLSAVKLATLFCLALLALIGLDALLSGTSLITPISPVLINVMRGVGLALGVPLAVLVVCSPNVPMSMLRKALVLLFLPLLTAFAGGEAAYRIADWIEFPFSSAAFVPASYPITHASPGRRGRRDSVEIDPFNLRDGTQIAVPRDQFESVWVNASDYCITVMQRRSASGAIEIINDGVFNLSPPARAILTACPEAKRAQ